MIKRLNFKINLSRYAVSTKSNLSENSCCYRYINTTASGDLKNPKHLDIKYNLSKEQHTGIKYGRKKAFSNKKRFRRLRNIRESLKCIPRSNAQAQEIVNYYLNSHSFVLFTETMDPFSSHSKLFLKKLNIEYSEIKLDYFGNKQLIMN